MKGGLEQLDRLGSFNKSSSYVNRNKSKGYKPGRLLKKIDKKFIEKVFNQLIAASVIALMIIVISNFNSPLIDQVIQNVKWVVGTNYDFAAAANSVVPGISSSLSDIPGTLESIFNKGDAVNTMSGNIETAMVYPVYGKVTSGSGTGVNTSSPGNAGQNTGINIEANEGTPIKAALEGTVEKIEENNTYGRVITIKHDSNLKTTYGHCSEVLVDEGQKVKQGDYIGKVGDTGTAASPCLHFEVIKDGKQIDPLSMLEDALETK